MKYMYGRKHEAMLEVILSNLIDIDWMGNDILYLQYLKNVVKQN